MEEYLLISECLKLTIYFLNFQNPFCKPERSEKFGSSGRSLSAPDSYDYQPHKKSPQEAVNMPAMKESSTQGKS